MYIGSWKLEDFLTFSCTTHAATSGKLTDADGLPNFRVYEDATDSAVTTGSIPKLDDANTTGFYNKRIQITAASSFEKGKSYTIYKEGTVYGRKAAIEDHFQIEAEVDANVVSDKTGFALSAAGVDDILDEIIEGTLTLRQIARILLSRAAGEATGGGTTTINFRDNADSKNRITMTVDVNGNRSSIVLDGS